MKVCAGLAPPVRTTRRRHPRVLRGAISLLLWVAMAGGLATVLGSALSYWRGHSAGSESATAERNAHWRGVLDTLQDEHAKQLRAETAKSAEDTNRMARSVHQAQEHLEHERQATARLRGDLAAAVQRHDRMRDALAAAATGGRTEADDSLPACRARADAIGRVLGEALQAHERCSLDAEDLASGVRTLRDGWPQ